MESDLVTSLNRLSIKQSTYQNFIELSKSTKTIDLVVYFKSFQKLVDGVAKKKTELETQLDNLTMKIKELETVFANTDDEVTKLQKIRKEEEKNRLDNKIELADELHETMQTIFNARKKYLVDLKSWGRGPEEIASVKLTLTKNIKEKRIIKATQEAKLEKENNILEDYCARYFDNSRKRIIQQIEIEDLQIEFNDGKIENLVVMGSVKASTGGCDERKFKRLEFTNVIPFGFTSKKELEQLNKRWIYTDGEDGEFYKMNVGKLFRNYVEKLEVDRRDYSPRNQVITLKRNGKEFNENENKYSVVLKKEYTHEILGGAIFTDFAGLSGDEPNGIIQTEVYKELPIVTDRILFGVKTRKAINDFNLGIKRKYVRANMGLLAYMRPLFVISKIENEKKVLPLDSKEVTYNGETEKIYFASTLDLRKHETFRVGFDMNVALFDFPELKSTIYLDYGLYWGRTKVGEVKPEGENREYGVDVFEHGPRLVWEVFTDERYGFRLGFNYNWYYARTNDFQQVGDPDMYSQTNLVEDQSQRPNQYWSTEILAFLKPNKDGRGKFFFRYRLNVKSKYWNQTWSQMQLGYAFSITKTTAPKIND